MLKKDGLEEFLFRFTKAEYIPFTNWEDALVNNYTALDVPFSEYYDSTTGWYEYLQVEISENLLSLPVNEKFRYLKYLEDKLRLESWEFDNKNLLELLKEYKVDVKTLDFKLNKQLNELLNKSFKSISDGKNIIKFRDLHREYYKYLLDVERTKVIEYIKELIISLDRITTEDNKQIVSSPIFANPNGYLIFVKLLDYLNIKDTTTRGNKAKLAGIWQASISSKKLFKKSTTKKEYLDYINSIFGSDFTTKSFSDGSNHELMIKQWLSEQEF